MPKICIKNGNLALKDRIINNGSVVINDSKIASVGKNVKTPKGAIVIDAKDAFVSPGFIDCHIHGEPKKIFLNEARHGTTAFVVSQSCAPLELIYKRAESIREFIDVNPFGANLLGLRLEGPYINKERAGAQDKRYIKAPDLRELAQILRRCRNILKIMTIAPEVNGATPLIRLLRRNGVMASIGHSDASYEEAVEGMDAGIRHATHTFNAMSPLDRRSPGVIGTILLDDRVTAEIILDLVHVHRALFALLAKAKKRGNVIIVTDSIVAEPHKGAMRIGGAYRFEGGRLAGSCLTMIEALKNAVTKCGLALPEALKMITLNPARLLGVEGRKGSLEAGKDADIVVFDKNFDVKMTMVRGRISYRK